jgi:hypothetical protein
MLSGKFESPIFVGFSALYSAYSWTPHILEYAVHCIFEGMGKNSQASKNPEQTPGMMVYRVTCKQCAAEVRNHFS